MMTYAEFKKSEVCKTADIVGILYEDGAGYLGRFSKEDLNDSDIIKSYYVEDKSLILIIEGELI
jgi:hypothetical protein